MLNIMRRSISGAFLYSVVFFHNSITNQRKNGGNKNEFSDLYVQEADLFMQKCDGIAYLKDVTRYDAKTGILTEDV